MIRKDLLFIGLSMVLALLSWVLPNHYFPWVTFYSDFSAFLALLLVGCFVLSCRPLVFSISVICFLGAGLVPLAQWVGGLVAFFGDALMASLYLLGGALAVALGRGLVSISRSKAFGAIAWVIAAGAVLSTWIALCQWLRISDSLWVVELPLGGRPYANLAQPNSLATLLCLGLAAVLYLWEVRRLGWVVASVLAVFLVVGVVLTQSRTPWVGALCFLLWWGWKAQKCSLRLPVSQLVLWVAGYAALVLAFPYISDALYLSAASLGERAQALQRLDLWSQLWLAVLQGGWWGYGWNQVSVAQVAISLAYPVPLMVEHSHNLILDLLLWNGPLIGGLIIVLAGGWLGRLAWKASSLESVFAMLVVILVLMHGMLEFPLEYAFFLIPVCLFLGMVEANQGVAALIQLPRKGGVLLVLVSGCLMGWVWYEYRIIEEDHRLMRFESAQIGNLKAQQAAPDVVLLTQLREFLGFARTQAIPNMTLEQMEMMRKVAHRYPYPPSLFRYSLALALNGQSEQAKLELIRLRALHGEELYEEARRGMVSMSGRYPQLNSLQLVEYSD